MTRFPGTGQRNSASASVARQLQSVSLRYRLGSARQNAKTPAIWRFRELRRPATAVVSDKDKLANLEAVLFLAKDPLNTRKLSQLASLADGTEARTLIGQLNRRYDACNRPFRVHRFAGGYQLLTRPVVFLLASPASALPTEVRLSAPAMETLAVVAYRQPVLRADIEAIEALAAEKSFDS